MDADSQNSSVWAKSFKKHVAVIPDHRVVGRTDHKLFDIVFIAVCGTIAACDDWKTIALWAKAKANWLEKYCELPNGIPSVSTLIRFFRHTNPESLQKFFIGWMGEISKITEGKTISFDGKSVRRSFNHADGKGCIHVVNAWISENRMVLGQIKAGERSNEIEAIPELLELLDIKGAVVTIDAIGCQKEIVRTIRSREADYCITVKANQPSLLEDIRAAFEETPEMDMRHYTTENTGHGRTEIRKYSQLTDLSGIRAKAEWEGLKSVVRVERFRFSPEGGATETLYYISSLGKGVRKVAKAIRDHWGIENSLHYVLDVTFKEDDSRIRTGDGAENMATLRRVAMNFINNVRDMKLSVKNRRMSAAFDDSVLEKILGF